MKIQIKIIISLFLLMLLLSMNKNFGQKNCWLGVDYCKNILEKWKK